MDGENYEELFEQTAKLLDEGKFEEALQALDRFPQPLEEAEDRIEWVAMRGWALAELHRAEEALEMIEPLMEEFPEAPRLLATLGVVLMNCDRVDEALAKLEQAYEVDPDDELILVNLAMAYERVREYRRAIALYDQAIDKGVSLDWALQQKAAVLADSGMFEEAVGTWRRYLSLVPDDAYAWMELANAYADMQQYPSACGAFEQAAKLKPDEPEIHINWGFALTESGDAAGARAQLEKVRELEKRTPRLQLLEASVLECEGHARLAEQTYERVLAEVEPEAEADHSVALELAMDFYARHRNRKRCDELLRRAYVENACSVGLCEAYREIETRFAKRAYWVSMIIEADFRTGLRTPSRRAAAAPPARVIGAGGAKARRYRRNFKVVARDRDDAVAMVLDFAAKMGEKHARVREIVHEETLDDTYTGLYEIDRDCVLLDPPATSGQ
ncbi:MAG: tetratricopeptide repeat protein [Phycisphaerae bacterium]|nr:tetratricopeptide repeat protein [Phycisphaerae bacterium]